MRSLRVLCWLSGFFFLCGALGLFETGASLLSVVVALFGGLAIMAGCFAKRIDDWMSK